MPYFKSYIEPSFHELKDWICMLFLDHRQVTFVVVLAVRVFSKAYLIVLKSDLNLVLVVLS